MIYVGDRGYNAASRASIDQGCLNLPDGARYSYATIAVKMPEGVGIISKLIPAPDAPFRSEFIYVFPKVRTNI
jgi:hypothetical protein